MSWKNYKEEITTILNSRRYRNKSYEEVPDNVSIENASMSKKDAVYSLEWIGMDEIKSHIDSKYGYHHLVKLEVKYVNMGTSEIENNTDEFLSIVSEIVALDNFNNFSQERPSARKPDQKHTIYKLIFIYGQESLC